MFQSRRKKYLARFLLSLLIFSSFGSSKPITNNIVYADDTSDLNNGNNNSDNKKKEENVVTEDSNVSDPNKQNGYEKDLDNKEGRDLISQSILELSESAEKGATKVANALAEIAKNPSGASAKAKSYLVALKNHANENAIGKLLGSKLINNNFISMLKSDANLKRLLSQALPQSVYNNLMSLINNATSSSTNSMIESNISSTLSLSGTAIPHSMSDLLASVIFSLNEKDGKADGARISFSDLEKYPASSDKLQVYGRLQSPNSKDEPSTAGRDLVSYLHTLYGFDYLVPIPKSSSEAKTVSGFLYCLFHEGKESVKETVFGRFLTTAKWGASLYDISISAINGLTNLLPKFDFFSLLGLSDAKSPDGVIGRLYGVLANTFGLSRGWVQALTRLSVLLMTTFLLISVMVSLAKSVSDRKGILGKFKRWGIRIAVILFLVPIATVLRGAIDDVTNDIMPEKQIINDFNNRYVVDTLTWAATTNLSLGMINGGNIVSGANSEDTSSFNRRNWNFRPTPENIERLNNVVQAKAQEAGLTSEDLSYIDAEGKKQSIVRNQASTASELFEKLSSKETVNVNDYLAMIRKVGNTNNIVAASFTPIGKNFSLGDGFSKKNYGTGTNNQVISPFFLEKREGLEDDKNGQAPTQSDDSDNKYSFNIAGKDFKVNQDSPIKPTYVSWHNLAYYIYGANSVSATSKEQSIFYNFIYGNGTKQNVSPEDGNVPSDEKIKQSMNLNAASIALMNRYSGITKIGGANTPSLSTQSTVFLLQSHSAGGNLDYSGINTSPSESGKTKNAGVTGNKFVRYVIPNHGKFDVMYKIGLLSTTWISAGFTAAFVLLYLFRCGFLGMFWKMFKNFIVAQTTGNIVSALDFFVYYMALKLTFVFARLGLNFGTWILSFFLNLVPALSTGIAMESGVKGFFDSIPILGKITSFIPPAGVLLLAPIICLLLTWPMYTIKLGSNNTPRRVSPLELAVNGGYLLAEACEEYLDTFHRRIFGKSRSQTFGAKLKNQAQPINQRELLKEKGGQLAKAGLAVATGGMSTAASMGALSGKLATAGSTVGNTIGNATENITDNFRENGIVGGLKATFTNAKDKVSDVMNGKVGNAGSDEFGMEMPERGNLTSFFNAKKDINNRTDIYGNDPLHYDYKHDKNSDKDITQNEPNIKQDATKQENVTRNEPNIKQSDVKQDDVKQDDVKQDNVTQNKPNIRQDDINTVNQVGDLNINTKDTNIDSTNLDSVLSKNNEEFSKQVNNFKSNNKDKDNVSEKAKDKFNSEKITTENLEVNNSNKVASDTSFEKPKSEKLLDNDFDKISQILNKKDDDFAKKAEYGMDNFSHKIADKMAKSYQEAIPEFKNVLGQREVLKDQAKELKVKIDNGTANDVEKSTYKAYSKEIANLDKQVKNFENSFDKVDVANKFYTNLGNKINKVQDSNVGKYFGTLSRMIGDNLQSDGKGDRASKYIERVETLENKKADIPYGTLKNKKDEKSFNRSAEEDLAKLLKDMMKQNQEQHDEMMKATTENTNVLDQLGLNTKEGL